jgi:hypothetical protein
MTSFIIPVIVIGLILAVSFFVTAAAARRLGRAPDTALPPGLTLVEGPGCRLCPEIRAQAERSGVTPHVITGPPGKLESLRVKGIPTVFVVDAMGSIRARRTGEAALLELGGLLDMVADQAL